MKAYISIVGFVISLSIMPCFAQMPSELDEDYDEIYQEEVPWQNEYISAHQCLKEINKAPYMVLFDVNQYNIPKPFMKNVQFTAKCLKEHPPISLIIEGFSAFEGNENTNDMLSILRAEAFATELIKLGIEESRIATYGLGAYEKTSAHGWHSRDKYKRRIKVIPYVDIKRQKQLEENSTILHNANEENSTQK